MTWKTCFWLSLGWQGSKLQVLELLTWGRKKHDRTPLALTSDGGKGTGSMRVSASLTWFCDFLALKFWDDKIIPNLNCSHFSRIINVVRSCALNYPTISVVCRLMFTSALIRETRILHLPSVIWNLKQSILPCIFLDNPQLAFSLPITLFELPEVSEVQCIVYVRIYDGPLASPLMLLPPAPLRRQPKRLCWFCSRSFGSQRG